MGKVQIRVDNLNALMVLDKLPRPTTCYVGTRVLLSVMILITITVSFCSMVTTIVRYTLPLTKMSIPLINILGSLQGACCTSDTNTDACARIHYHLCWDYNLADVED